MKISIIVPTFNEEKLIISSIKTIISYLQSAFDDFEIIVSDDGSSDKTRELIEVEFHDRREILLISNAHKGKGYAIRKGIEEASGDLLYLCDADLSTPIDVLKILISKLNDGYDIVIASREGRLAKRIGEPFYRHLMGRGFNLLVKTLLLPGISDTQCGFKLFKSDVAKKLFGKQRLYSEESLTIEAPAVTAYDVEILFLAKKFGYKVSEVEVSWEYRENTRVSVLRDSYRNLSDVLKVRLNEIQGKYDS